MKKYYIYKITTERLSSEVCILVNASDPKEVAAINKEIDFYNGLTWDSVYGKPLQACMKLLQLRKV